MKNYTVLFLSGAPVLIVIGVLLWDVNEISDLPLNEGHLQEANSSLNAPETKSKASKENLSPSKAEVVNILTNLSINSNSPATKPEANQNKSTVSPSKKTLVQKTKTKRSTRHRQVFQTKHIDESRLSHSTLLITGKVKNPNSTERFKAVHPSHLKGVDAINREALYTWLATPDPKTRGYLGENALKNNLLKSLILLGKDASRLQDLMISMLEDTTADPIWRDYVLQHLPVFEAVHLNQAPSHSTNFVTSSLYSTPAVIPTHVGIQNSSVIESSKTLPKNLDTKIFVELSEYYSADPKLAGTALIAWNLILEQKRKPKTKLLGSAWKVASSPDFFQPSRITALQILAQNHDLRALDLASQLFREAKAFSLKLSAISVLGQLGGKNELELLSKVSDSPSKDNHLSGHFQKIAVRKAVQNINKRLNI